jgi:NAD(P)H-nitrite reductase large subunit
MRYAIVGGGIAAVSAAKALQSYDPNGHITVISEEQHCFYYRPMTPLLIKGDRERDEILHNMRGLDIHMLQGRAASLDPERREITLAGGEKVEYDRLLIATGSSPKVPGIPGIREPNVHYLRTLADAQGLRAAAQGAQKAVILGGGFVGIKKAEALAHLGLQVTVVEQQSHILLPRLDREGAALVAAPLVAKGVSFILEDTVREILPGAKGVKLASGRQLDCDFVCIAVGVQPNIGWLKGSGLASDKALVVDANLQTSRKEIYGAGDVVQIRDLVTGRPVVSGLWSNAVEMGKVAGANMAGGKIRYPGGLEVMNAAEIEGIPLISVGHVLPQEGEGYEIHRRSGKQGYRKLIFKDDVLAGAIFVGDIEGSGVYTALIKAGKHLGALKEKAVEGTISFADFLLAER